MNTTLLASLLGGALCNWGGGLFCSQKRVSEASPQACVFMSHELVIVVVAQVLSTVVAYLSNDVRGPTAALCWSQWFCRVPSNDVWSQRVRTCRTRTRLFGLPGIPASKPFALAFLICLWMFSRVRYKPFDEQSKTMKESSCLMPMVQQLTVFQLYYELNLYLQRVWFSQYTLPSKNMEPDRPLLVFCTLLGASFLLCV